MPCQFAPEFFEALVTLEPAEQAQANRFVCRFHGNAAHSSASLERLNKVPSKDVWSARVSRDLRAILHKDGAMWTILHVGHHDAAYDWAERRQVGRHSVTGALQVVETISESSPLIAAGPGRAGEAPRLLFAQHKDAYLLSLGVPEIYLPVLRQISSEDQLMALVARLPEEVMERLMDLAAGEMVLPPEPISPEQPVEAAPDHRSRFYIIDDGTDLASILEQPMHRWLAFLHPSQRSVVEREFRGPAKVSGSAGTGKTVVAMHRARFLARKGGRVLLTSFVRTLCENLEINLRLLCSKEELERIRVATVEDESFRILNQTRPDWAPCGPPDVDDWIRETAEDLGSPFDVEFLQAEWRNVVRSQGAFREADYRAAQRIGRGRPLGARDRREIWRVFEIVRERMEASGRIDPRLAADVAAEEMDASPEPSPYDAVIVDEVQDLAVPELRLLRALCRDNPGGLMVVGDAAQRIFPGGFSLAALGIEVRGRSQILRLNYRTTEQIRSAADRLVDERVDDFEGGTESRRGTRSLLRGPQPRFRGFPDRARETTAAVARIEAWLGSGIPPEGIAVFARTAQELGDVHEALQSLKIPAESLGRHAGRLGKSVRLGTMHRAKGLEFRAVLVVGCAEGIVPLQKQIERNLDPQDRRDRLAEERRLLYVAMTRAREELEVTWVERPSPFLVPLLEAGKRSLPSPGEEQP